MEEMEIVILHDVFFMCPAKAKAGYNMGKTLNIHSQKAGAPPFRMFYDSDKEDLIVEMGSDKAYIPKTSIFARYPLKKEQKPEIKAPVKALAHSAQASTPNDHVFQGKGAGRTNDR